jgi:hypothetical protein
VEPEVNPYENDHPQVTPHGDKINKEKHNENDNLLMEKIGKAQKMKLSHCCLILLFHWSAGIGFKNKKELFYYKTAIISNYK